MANEQLIEYIKEELAEGYTAEQVKDACIKAGWPQKDVEKTLAEIGAPGASVPDAKKEGGKKLMIAVISIAGALLLGGGVFGYFMYYRTPSAVFARAVEGFDSISSFEYSVDVSVDITGENLFASWDDLNRISEDSGPVYASGFLSESSPSYIAFVSPDDFLGDTSPVNVNININLEGAADISDRENIKNRTKIEFGVDMRSEGSNFGLSGAGEVISLDNTTYFSLSSAPDMFGFLDFSPIRSKWIKFEEEDREELGEVFAGSDERNMDEMMEDIVSRTGQYSKISKLSNERINGTRVERYAYEIMDMKYITDVYSEVAGIDDGLMGDETEFKKFEGEIWIGKNDNRLYKITYHIITEDSISGELADIKIGMELRNYNTEVNISAPEESISVDEAFSLLLSYPFTDSRISARDANRQADIRSLSTAMELCYDSAECGAGQFAYPAGAEMPDDELVSSGFFTFAPRDPLTDEPYNWVNNTGNSQGYCLWAETEDVPAAYYTADSTGVWTITQGSIDPFNISEDGRCIVLEEQDITEVQGERSRNFFYDNNLSDLLRAQWLIVK